MRRTTIAIIATALLATLTACGSSSGKPAAAKPKATPTVSKETTFLKTARQIEFNGAPSDDALLAFPPQWCDAVDAGHSVAWIFDMSGGNLYPVGDDWGTVKQDADTLLVAGVKAYCPKNSDAVTKELRESGAY